MPFRFYLSGVFLPAFKICNFFCAGFICERISANCAGIICFVSIYRACRCCSINFFSRMCCFISRFCLCCSAVAAGVCLFSCFLTCSICCYLSFIPSVSCSFKMISIIFTDMLMLVIIFFNPAAPFMACRRDFC